jgi:Tfp pilus assembly major pilin PilA
MENTKYQYITLKVETKQEYKEAKKLLLSGWVALNILCNGSVVQFCKISE